VTITTTSRASASNGTTGAQTLTSASFTPAANSKVYIVAWTSRTGGAVTLDITLTTTITGWTSTPVGNRLVFPTPANFVSDSTFHGTIALFEGHMGASPSAGTITLDWATSTGTAWGAFQVFDATGSTALPSIKSGQLVANAVSKGGGNSETATSATLPSTTVSGNTVVAAIGCSIDTSGAASTPTPATFSAITTPQTATNSTVGIWKNTAMTNTVVSWSDCGQQVGIAGTVVFELEEAGGSSDGTATPAAISVARTMPASTQNAGSSTTPAATSIARTMPASTQNAGSTTTPAATPIAVTLPNAGTGTSATSTPAATSVARTMPLSAQSAGSSSSPAAITVTRTMPAASKVAGWTVSASATQVVVAMPAPSLVAGQITVPGVIPITVTIPAATATAAQAGTATPGAIGVAVALAAAQALAGSGVSPDVISVAVTLPGPTVPADATATPGAITVVVELPDAVAEMVVEPAGPFAVGEITMVVRSITITSSVTTPANTITITRLTED
jgi:hypothetical protein